MKRLIFILILLTLFDFCPVQSKVVGHKIEVCEVTTPLKQLELNEENLYQVMDSLGIHHQDIVMRQAKLESGNFKSKLCVNKHNIFGLRGKKGYYSYPTWIDCVIAYKNKIQSRYRQGEDYYSFLKRIRYCIKPSYVNSLKKIHVNKK
jgi:hypothetical protein